MASQTFGHHGSQRARDLDRFGGRRAGIREGVLEQLGERLEKGRVGRQAGLEVERRKRHRTPGQSDIWSNSVRVFCTSDAICAFN